ncbi:MAG: hypothetical protein HUJ30_06630 [Gammaproteobacteria bacterium]|nr:hypothetical protein [Gammaproteobacteria bacterium]
MQIGGSSGSQAAQQLLQATQQVASMSTNQLQAVSNKMAETKASAMENTAGQVAAAAERKGNLIDVII